MFYNFFRRTYLSMKKRIEKENRTRISKEILPEGVLQTEYYYKDSKNPLHQFNLYKTMDGGNKGDLPLIIDIHGGGWLCGDKDTNRNFNYHLTLGGYDVSSLSYRTIDECTIKEQMTDIFAYLQFLKNHGEQLNISFEKVVLTGDSAGWQLALLAYCTNQSRILQKLFAVPHIDMEIKCLILNHSVCYLDEAGRLPGHPLLSRFVSVPGLQRMLYGKGFAKNELYKNTFNPEKYIFKETKLPPVLLITSIGDTAYRNQTLKLFDFFSKLEKVCELYDEDDNQAEHVFNVAFPENIHGKKCNEFIFYYIRKYIS